MVQPTWNLYPGGRVREEQGTGPVRALHVVAVGREVDVRHEALVRGDGAELGVAVLGRVDVDLQHVSQWFRPSTRRRWTDEGRRGATKRRG